MEKNKSIDGLVSSRSKRAAKKPTVAKKTTTIKKPVSTRKPKPVQKSKNPKVAPTASTEDFLEPVKAFDFNEGDQDLKIAKKSEQTPIKKAEKKKKKPGKVRKTIVAIALTIVLLLIGGGIWLIIWGNDIIAKITGGQGTIFDLFTFMNETYEPLKTDENGRTNILAFGTSGYNMSGDDGRGGEHDGAALTDSIMAISLNQETGDIAMVSLPRDLKVYQTCTATSKINEVYWCNNMDGDNEKAGAEALMATVGEIIGVDFQYYAHVNWSSVVQIVNLLEGITVSIDEDVLDYYNTGYSYYAGNDYFIDGNQALILARARYGTTGGDFTRSNNQQKILIGIKNRLLEKKLSIPDYLSLASTLGDNLRTNFTVEELKSIAHLTFKFNFDSMRQISLLEPEQYLTTGMINGISYVLPVAGSGNYGKIQNYIAKMISDDPRIYEEPSILILNGTEENGLAANEKTALENEGYENISVDNAPEKFEEKYTLFALSEKPGTKALLEQHYNITAKNADEVPEAIPRDYDFIIIIGGKRED